MTNYFKQLFKKRGSTAIPPMPAWKETVSHMKDTGLDGFSDEVTEVIYSADCEKRYVLLRKETGLYTYIFESLTPLDELEWEYIIQYKSKYKFAAIWELKTNTKSLFETKEDALRELKKEPEYINSFRP